MAKLYTGFEFQVVEFPITVSLQGRDRCVVQEIIKPSAVSRFKVLIVKVYLTRDKYIKKSVLLR